LSTRTRKHHLQGESHHKEYDADDDESGEEDEFELDSADSEDGSDLEVFQPVDKTNRGGRYSVL
jgi:hypothetical protein